ncbi:MAG: GGDEF domain-containing protein [Acidimicrobiales bacterium]
MAAAVVEDAAEHVEGLAWVVGRAEGDELVVVCAAGNGTAMAVGDRITPDPDADVVVPVELPDGATFGALCGVGPDRLADGSRDLVRAQRLGELLSAVASAEWEADAQAARADAEARRARQIEEEALRDALTGLHNRRAWDRALESEERRQRRYGGTAAIIVIDLDELKEINDAQGHLHGDLLLQVVGRIIRDTSRESDVVARTGGDEFAVLAINCEEPQLNVLLSRLRAALDEEGVSASVGGACKRAASGMADAWAEADDVMFAEKQRRKKA